MYTAPRKPQGRQSEIDRLRAQIEMASKSAARDQEELTRARQDAAKEKAAAEKAKRDADLAMEMAWQEVVAQGRMPWRRQKRRQDCEDKQPRGLFVVRN